MDSLKTIAHWKLQRFKCHPLVLVFGGTEKSFLFCSLSVGQSVGDKMSLFDLFLYLFIYPLWMRLDTVEEFTAIENKSECTRCVLLSNGVLHSIKKNTWWIGCQIRIWDREWAEFHWKYSLRCLLWWAALHWVSIQRRSDSGQIFPVRNRRWKWTLRSSIVHSFVCTFFFSNVNIHPLNHDDRRQKEAMEANRNELHLNLWR